MVNVIAEGKFTMRYIDKRVVQVERG